MKYLKKRILFLQNRFKVRDSLIDELREADFRNTRTKTQK